MTHFGKLHFISLIEENSGLKTKLYNITQERNDQLETVDNVNDEKRQLRGKLLGLFGVYPNMDPKPPCATALSLSVM